MASRGWEGVTLNDVQHRRKAPQLPQVKSKYRNVKVVIGSETFDSKREAAYWQGLLARQRAGEITNLRRQVAFPLLCPFGEWPNIQAFQAFEVATFVADFVYEEQGTRHVVDAKGHRTAMYKLKKKWLFLQTGIVIEEV